MKPAPFTYVRAETGDEAIDALREHGDEAKVLAGGQSLVPLMNLRLAAPRVLVDVNPIAELQGIAVNGSVEIGAVTRQAAVARSAEVREHAPLAVACLRHVAYPGVRRRGTFGGSAAHADPAAEIPAVLVALGAELVVCGPAGERTIAADDFFVSYFTTALAPDEVLTRIRLPRRTAAHRFGFQEVARKHGDFALAGAAVAAEVADGICRSARIVLFGVGERPVRALAAEEAVVDRALGGDAAREAERIVRYEFEGRSDSHASAAYRKEVAGVMTRRAILQAKGGQAA